MASQTKIALVVSSQTTSYQDLLLFCLSFCSQVTRHSFVYDVSETLVYTFTDHVCYYCLGMVCFFSIPAFSWAIVYTVESFLSVHEASLISVTHHKNSNA